MRSRILFKGRLSISDAAKLRGVFQRTAQGLASARVSRRALLCVIPFAVHEVEQTIELLQWIRELGGCPKNPCLLVADCRFPASALPQIFDLASKCFLAVDFVQTPRALDNEAWPYGPNWMFETAARHIAKNYRLAWWWNEPDAIPLCEGFLTTLGEHYWRAAQPFMGCIVQPTPENPCEAHLTGCAVYPHNAIDYIASTFGGHEAWDFASRKAVLPHTAHSLLLQSEWGSMGKPPTFRSASELSRLNPRAVVYHRNKDGSLIRFLRAAHKLSQP